MFHCEVFVKETVPIDLLEIRSDKQKIGVSWFNQILLFHKKRVYFVKRKGLLCRQSYF